MVFRKTLSVFILLILNELIVNGQECSWFLPGASGPFVLTEARGYHAMCFDTSGGQPGTSYTITPCGNYAQCEPGNLVMGTLFDRNSGTCTATTALWDNGATAPVYSVQNGKRVWSFRYTNGNSGVCPEYVMNVNWVCEPQMQPPFGPASSNVCYANSPCESTMDIPTPYACVTGPLVDDELGSTGMKNGWWFTISLIIILILYCGIGYYINGKRNENMKDCMNNVPHLKEFWCMLPRWTWAGCCVTKEFIQKKLRKDDTYDLNNQHETSEYNEYDDASAFKT